MAGIHLNAHIPAVVLRSSNTPPAPPTNHPNDFKLYVDTTNVSSLLKLRDFSGTIYNIATSTSLPSAGGGVPYEVQPSPPPKTGWGPWVGAHSPPPIFLDTDPRFTFVGLNYSSWNANSETLCLRPLPTAPTFSSFTIGFAPQALAFPNEAYDVTPSGYAPKLTVPFGVYYRYENALSEVHYQFYGVTPFGDLYTGYYDQTNDVFSGFGTRGSYRAEMTYYLNITRSGTVFTFGFSSDGIYFYTVGSLDIAPGVFLDEVGYGFANGDAYSSHLNPIIYPSAASIFHFELT